MQRFAYTTDCTRANARSVLRMSVFRKEVTFGTIIKRCAGLPEFAEAMGFADMYELAEHPGVAFYRSRFERKACYYARIDGVKYIWCAQEQDADDAVRTGR